MNQKIIYIVLIIFYGCSLVCAEENVTLTVLTEQKPPYSWEENGEIKGFSTEIVKEMLKRAGYKYSMRCIPWDGAYQTTINHENVMIYSIVRIKERESLFKWVGILAPYPVYLFKLKKRQDIQVSTLEDVKKYIIGVVKNDARHLIFQGKEGYKLDIVREDSLNIKKLFSDRVDLVPFKEITLKERIMDMKGYSFDDLEKVLLVDDLSSDFYAAFGNKTSDDIVEKCRNALDNIKLDGTFKEIAGRYDIPGL